MTSIGTGYDLSVSTYSPDGRLFQVCHSRRSGNKEKGVAHVLLLGRVRQQGCRGRWVCKPLIFSRCFQDWHRAICSVAIGLRCKDGVLLGVERILHSKLLVKGANRRIASLDEHIGMAGAGLLADGKHLASRGRDEASNFRDNYNTPVTVQVSLFQSVLNHG